MTYSLALRNGDLSVGGSRVNTVTGRAKLLQDLDTWFREQYQVDRFHPSYGSTLPDYIGTVGDEMTLFLIRSEAVRILNNYQQVQMAAFSANPNRFSGDELIHDIVSVEAKSGLESVQISVKLRTVSGANILFERGVSI